MTGEYNESFLKGMLGIPPFELVFMRTIESKKIPVSIYHEGKGVFSSEYTKIGDASKPDLKLLSGDKPLCYVDIKYQDLVYGDVDKGRELLCKFNSLVLCNKKEFENYKKQNIPVYVVHVYRIHNKADNESKYYFYATEIKQSMELEDWGGKAWKCNFEKYFIKLHEMYNKIFNVLGFKFTEKDTYENMNTSSSTITTNLPENAEL